MAFTPHTQEELKEFNIIMGSTYAVEYANKDYFNGEDRVEKAMGRAFTSDGKIYLNVVDPCGMDKMVMQVRVLEA